MSSCILINYMVDKIIMLYFLGNMFNYNHQSWVIVLSEAVKLNVVSTYPKEISHRDGSFENPQHLFLLRN